MTGDSLTMYATEESNLARPRRRTLQTPRHTSDATYGASVTTTSSRLVIALAITVAALMLVGFLAVLDNFTG